MCTDRSLITDQLREGEVCLHHKNSAECPTLSLCTCFIRARVSLADLTAAVGKRVCDMRWEVRDSTVEFLGHLATEPGGGSASEALLSRGWITSLLTVALQDAESYVRASAVAGLAGTLTQRCQQGAAGEEVGGIATNVAQKPTENVPINILKFRSVACKNLQEAGKHTLVR